ncbi:hypothetical protein CANARDRAFT_30151 [[Candida] arabinofermentans NRRL YB-2248]|uniref:Nitrogen regulatory protein areA GATA-like domain-containing protein n=1 Tax=[Candida] arabinofermentans NRRL YB-2248 TaxID=983967 RepID=A0A1E4SUN0_9ASCO|nr:hypothetical protein CANARDRAFT_30151 [[Candida] arabinofermentans NRRL YB-2248]
MSHYLDKRKKSPPFLELSNSTIELLEKNKHQLSAIDFDNVLTLWTTLIKSSDFIKNGKRLENISWRVVNRNLLLKNDFNFNDFSTLIDISTKSNDLKITNNNTKPITKRIPSSGSTKSQQLLQPPPPRPQQQQQQQQTKPTPSLFNSRPQRPTLIHSNSKIKSQSSVKIEKGTNEITAEISNSENDSSISDSESESDVEVEDEDEDEDETVTESKDSHPSLFNNQTTKQKQTSLPKNSLTQSNLNQQQSLIEKQSQKQLNHEHIKANTPQHQQHSIAAMSNRMFYIENSPSPEQVDPHLLYNNHHVSPIHQPSSKQATQSRLKNSSTLKNSQSPFINNHQHQQQQQQTITHSLFGQQRPPSKSPQHQHQHTSPQIPHHRTDHLENQHQLKHDSRLKTVSEPRHDHSSLKNPSNPSKHHSHVKDHQQPEDDMEHLYQQQIKYNSTYSNAGLSPQSETQKSHASLFGNNQPQQSQPQILFSSDDDFSDGSDWSSVSNDSEFDDDDDDEDDHLDFNKKDNYEKLDEPSNIKRSLLSGLFLDKMPQESESESQKTSSSSSNTNNNMRSPKLIISPVLPPVGHHPHPDQLEMTPKSTAVSASLTNFTASANDISNISKPTRSSISEVESNDNANANSGSKVNSSHVSQSAADLLHSTQQQRPSLSRAGSNGIQHLVSKSAISLASFFANNRRPQTNDQQHNVYYDRHHESNAPATASTLLPTALSTHMFLPTMNLHQQQANRMMNRKVTDPHRPLKSSLLSPTNGSSGKNHTTSQNLSNSRSHGYDEHRLSNDNGISIDDNVNVNDHDHDGDEVEVEYSSSVKSSTTSIDIPNSTSSSSKSKSHYLLKESEKNNSVRDGSFDNNNNNNNSIRPKMASRGNSYITRVSPKSTVYEMIAKEIPGNLMDSINNENKLIHVTSSLSPNSSKMGKNHEYIARPLLSKNNSNMKVYSTTINHTNSTTSKQNGGIGVGGEDNDLKMNVTIEQFNDDEDNGNIIADGIMGKKFSILSHSKINEKDKNENENENKNDDDDDWDEDSLNYHARGW